MKIAIILLLSFYCSASILSADSLDTLYLAPNSTIYISLASNPTTGYSWYLSRFSCLRFKVSEVGYVPYECGLTGSGGVQIFQVTATSLSKEGDTADIEFRYERSWEKVPTQIKSLQLYATNDSDLISE